MLQLIGIDIQLKIARVFRLYVKSFGDRAVYRAEESLKMGSPLADALSADRMGIDQTGSPLKED
jgi:hypothetical protein